MDHMFFHATLRLLEYGLRFIDQDNPHSNTLVCATHAVDDALFFASNVVPPHYYHAEEILAQTRDLSKGLVVVSSTPCYAKASYQKIKGTDQYELTSCVGYRKNVATTMTVRQLNATDFYVKEHDGRFREHRIKIKKTIAFYPIDTIYKPCATWEFKDDVLHIEQGCAVLLKHLGAKNIVVGFADHRNKAAESFLHSFARIDFLERRGFVRDPHSLNLNQLITACFEFMKNGDKPNLKNHVAILSARLHANFWQKAL